ncbi:hypothetical protein Tco_0261556 [Tanacetum coccineum]
MILDTRSKKKQAARLPIDKIFPSISEFVPVIHIPDKWNFHIELYLVTAPVNAPLTIGPSEMKELRSTTRAFRKGFIRPSSTHGTPDLFIPKLQFLSYVIDNKGIHVDPSKIESVKECISKTPTENSSFRSIVPNLLKQKFFSAPILAYPKEVKILIVYCDASDQGFGRCVYAKGKWLYLMHHSSKDPEKTILLMIWNMDSSFALKIGGLSLWYQVTVSLIIRVNSIFLDQKELNMRQRRWLRVAYDYDANSLSPRKQNFVADALSMKETEPPLRFDL